MKIVSIALFVALVCPESILAAEGIIRLKDGNFLFGEVVAHDESGIQVRRLDTGGLVTLKWGHLFPAEEDELRIRYGYKDQSGEEVRLEADRLRLEDGSAVVGIIFDRTEKDIFLKMRGTTMAVPKTRVTGPVEKVQVNALDLFTKEELRDRKLAEINPQTAESWLEFGRFLVRIHDIKGALDAYKKAQATDASFHPEEVATSITRLEVQAARQEEVDFLDSIDSLRGKGEFAKALEMCQAFLQKWPQSTFQAEVNRKKNKIESDRAELLLKTVVQRWYTVAEKTAGKVGLDREMTLAQAQAYAESKMGKEILEKVTEDAKKLQPDITPEKVKAIWEKRGKLASSHRAAYGDGTFALGADKAHKGVKKEKDADKDKKKTADQEMQEKINRYVEQAIKAQRSAAGGSGASEEDAPEAWWHGGRGAERQQWILAYYAEFGGDMEVTSLLAEECQGCSGSGVITMLENAYGGSSGSQGGGRSGGSQSSGGGSVQLPCPTCHKIQIRRSVYFR